MSKLHQLKNPFYLKSFLHILIHAPCFPFSPFATSFSSSIMTIKISQLIHILIWLSLIFLLFHQYYNLKYSKINKKQIIHASHSILPSHHNRKVLARKFDLSPFFKHNKHPLSVTGHNGTSNTEIDPRYGVEKRRVPTGPNPLHHWIEF